MKKSYKLFIPLDGAKLKLFTFYKMLVAEEYTRIVIGDRGPYIEFEKLITENTYVPKDQLWRFNNSTAYYLEIRTTDASNIKIYGQLKRVDYADYLPGFYYISPHDLRLKDGKPLIQDF